jgi:hypothetical protein
MIEIKRVGEDDIPAMTAARLNYLTEMQDKRSKGYLQEWLSLSK